MRQMVLWDTACMHACNFNAVILNQSIFSCPITSAPTLSNNKNEGRKMKVLKAHTIGICVMHTFA